MNLAERIFARRGDWMQTYLGNKYWPIDPRADEVSIIDIAHALSMICRYTGHVDRFYSVAEHSWHVSYLCSPENALTGLLHDATEAYLTDVARPVKRYLTNYKQIEARNWRAIAEAFDLPRQLPEEVHHADASMLTVEKSALMKPGPKHDWGFPEPASPVKVFAWRPEVAETQFLQRFHELTAQRPQHPATSADCNKREVPCWGGLRAVPV